MMRVGLLAVLVLSTACGVQNGLTGTVDPGDNLIAPELSLDEDFFFCRIEPEVIQQFSCATGSGSDSGGCHNTRSALRLIDSDAAPPCDASGRVVGSIPDAFAANLEAARFFVQADPLTSPLYLRPINQASHPRAIFGAQDPAAKLIEEWISAGANN
jgi:hypothetical protein